MLLVFSNIFLNQIFMETKTISKMVFFFKLLLIGVEMNFGTKL